MFFDQNFSFLQVRACQFSKRFLTKISHFCRSRPVKVSKKYFDKTFIIFAGPDLSKFQKMCFDQNFSFLQVRTCQSFQKYFDKNFLIFAGPDLSKFQKMCFDQNFSFLQVRTCRNFQKSDFTKISHFCRSGPVKISKNVLGLKFLIFAGPDLS